jgi:hypothetical protein
VQIVLTGKIARVPFCLLAVARSRNEPECCVESGVCKGGCKCTVFDFFVKFQDLFDLKFDGALGRVLLCIKGFGTKSWEEFEPPALQKEEQKMQMFDHLVTSKVLAHATTDSSSSRKTSGSSSCSSRNSWQLAAAAAAGPAAVAAGPATAAAGPVAAAAAAALS